MNMSHATESPSTATPAITHTALAVILYGYDEWWLALPRSDADANEAIRTCNWLYISESANNTPSSKESFSYVIKERVKVVTSSCFLKDVTVEKTGKTTYSLSKSERERIDNAFALRLALEAKEQAAEASKAQRQAKVKPDDASQGSDKTVVVGKSAEGKKTSGKTAGSKRSRADAEVIEIDTSQSDADVSGGGLRKGKAASATATAGGSGHGARAAKGADTSRAGGKSDSHTENKEGRGRVPPPPPLPPILPNPLAPPSVTCVVAIILSSAARDSIFGVPSKDNEEALSVFRLHTALWDADIKACRLVERVPNPSARREDGADVDVMLHVYGPLLKEGVDFRFVPTDAQASVKGSSLTSILPAAVATKNVAVFELKVEGAKVLEAKRRTDFLRRQELANLPPPPMPTLVNIGGDNWAFCGAIVPPPCLPSKPKGIITPRQMLAQQRRGTPEDGAPPRDSQQQELYHFLHNGVVHSVPVATWNKKMSELSTDHFCRDTAKEAELSAKGFFLLLKHMRNTCV